MDNMIKKFNEELKYYFPESRLEAVLFEIPLSGSKGIDIRGDLNVMEFYKFLNFNKIWITENLQKYFHVENWQYYNVHPQKAGLGTFTKIAFTNEETQKRGCMNMQDFDPMDDMECIKVNYKKFEAKTIQHSKDLLQSGELRATSEIGRNEAALNGLSSAEFEEGVLYHAQGILEEMGLENEVELLAATLKRCPRI